MRSGVIFCVPSTGSKPSLNSVRLIEKLQTKGVEVLQCNYNSVLKEPQAVTDFVAHSEIQRVLIISNLSETPVMEALGHSIERAGVGRLAVGYLDVRLLSGGPAGSNTDDFNFAVASTNLARLEHADYIKNAVYRTVLGPAQISRRQLLRSVPRALRVESDIPIVLSDRCTHRSNSCNYCRNACPVNAISPTKDSVVIDDRLCLECGACARECPVGAIQSPSISDDQVIAMLSTLSSEELDSGNRLLLTCSRGLDRLTKEAGEDAIAKARLVPVTVPCVAAIGSAHHIWAASVGVNLVTVCPDSSCPRSAGISSNSHHVESSKSLLVNLGESDAAIQHLTLALKDSIIDKIPPAPQPIGKRTRVELSGLRRDETLKALRTLQAGKGSIQLANDHMLPFFDLAIDFEKCTLCGVCERECPDHAIGFTKEGGSESLMFDPVLCGGCIICEQVCPENAIKIQRNTNLTAILDGNKEAKTKDEDATCERCGTPIGSKRNLAALGKKLTNEKYPPEILRSLHICSKCKQQVIQPVTK